MHVAWESLKLSSEAQLTGKMAIFPPQCYFLFLLSLLAYIILSLFFKQSLLQNKTELINCSCFLHVLTNVEGIYYAILLQHIYICIPSPGNTLS